MRLRVCLNVLYILYNMHTNNCGCELVKNVLNGIHNNQCVNELCFLVGSRNTVRFRFIKINERTNERTVIYFTNGNKNQSCNIQSTQVNANKLNLNSITGSAVNRQYKFSVYFQLIMVW